VPSEDFVLLGLLYCPYENVREEFRQSLGALCHQLRDQSEKDKTSPLDYLLKLLSSNFARISEYPCQQYFQLFCELLDKHYLEDKLGATSSDNQVIDSEALLAAVISRIREENQRAQKARQDGQTTSLPSSVTTESADLLSGLISLAGKILDNSHSQPGSAVESTETSLRIQQQRGLIDEIFTRFLFPSVFDQDQSAKNKQLTMMQVIESKLEKK